MQVQSDKKIAIVGGGIAGSSIALYLGELGLHVTLFEKKDSLVDGPPICHLHAGGNLYREISDEQCITLLKESIELIQLYPCAVDFRPTLIAVPTEDKGNPEDLYPRLKKLKKEYQSLIDKDITNRVLGSVDDYYKTYDREAVEKLKSMDVIDRPISFDEWMIPAVKNIDLDKIKFPLVMVQEYGLNLFRLAASVSLALEFSDNVNVLKSTFVKDIKKKNNLYALEYEKDDSLHVDKFDYLINAAGFKSGEIDDMLGFDRERFVEFKAAYVTKWKDTTLWPEIIFHGERGTPRGMAQFTPYPGGYFQLHGMTEDITLFKDGLVKSQNSSAQPKLNQKYIDKIYKGWREVDVSKRSKLAISHLSQYIPSFESATITSKPLFGAQQIPGDDASLRAAEVSFDSDSYARCEIVKASSVLSMADAIVTKLVDLGFINKSAKGFRDFKNNKQFLEEDITKLAQKLCEQRNYPKCLAFRYNSSLIV